MPQCGLRQPFAFHRAPARRVPENRLHRERGAPLSLQGLPLGAMRKRAGTAACEEPAGRRRRLLEDRQQVPGQRRRARRPAQLGRRLLPDPRLHPPPLPGPFRRRRPGPDRRAAAPAPGHGHRVGRAGLHAELDQPDGPAQRRHLLVLQRRCQLAVHPGTALQLRRRRGRLRNQRRGSQDRRHGAPRTLPAKRALLARRRRAPGWPQQELHQPGHPERPRGRDRGALCPRGITRRRRGRRTRTHGHRLPHADPPQRPPRAHAVHHVRALVPAAAAAGRRRGTARAGPLRH